MRPGISRVAPCASLAGALLVATLTAPARAAPQYHITHEVKLPGDEGWDYLSFDDAGHRLFIAHGSQVLVIDTDQLTPAGAIANTPGVHGIALATDAGHGYISAGRSNTIVVFDLKTLARLKDIQATGENPDAILYDSATHRVFSFNGRGRNATVIDSKTDAVIGTIALDAKPEFAVSDGKGRVYVNLEDKSSIARIDAQHMSVTAVWPLEGCDDPSGLAIDVTGQRLFAGCGNKVMAVVDANSGRTLGTAPIGGGVDATKYDSGMRLAFAPAVKGCSRRCRWVRAVSPRWPSRLPRSAVRAPWRSTSTPTASSSSRQVSGRRRPRPSRIRIPGRQYCRGPSGCWWWPRRTTSGEGRHPPVRCHGGAAPGAGCRRGARGSRRRRTRLQRTRPRDARATDRDQHHRYPTR